MANIGQYLYSHNGTDESQGSQSSPTSGAPNNKYMTNMPGKIVPVQIGSLLTGEDANVSGLNFQDIAFQLDKDNSDNKVVFDVNTDYVFKIDIPQNLNYDMVFTIELVKSDEQDSGYKTYQYLKQIKSIQGTGAVHSKLVAIYESNQEVALATNSKETEYETHVCFPYDWTKEKAQGLLPGGDATLKPNGQDGYLMKNQDCLYYVKNDATGLLTYYRGDQIVDAINNGAVINPSNNDKQIPIFTHYNDVELAETWKTSDILANITSYIVFRPIEAGFDRILVKMARNTIDYNIQVDDKTFGRALPLSYYNADGNNGGVSPHAYVSALTNIVSNNQMINKLVPLDRIGVWGHPNLIMAVNGEEIRIGPNGFYELSDIPITSLGIVARSWADVFTIDYMYTENNTQS